MTLKGNTQVEVFYAEEHTTQIDVISIEKEDTTNSPQKFAAVVLISSSENISKAKPCDLEKALKSISLNHYFPCNHHDIKDDSSTLRKLGIALLVVNFIFFLLILIFPLLLPVCKLLVRTFILLVAISSAFTIMEYRSIFSLKAEEKDMNYVQLQSNLTIWLERHFTSDNISSSDVISNNWNKFFIKYDCCAITQVQGTTNDFDSTPWCTTAGTCQTTASQIPKTCCNYVTEEDYGIAPPGCHSSVNPGTFRSNCMNVIKQLSVVNIDECQLSLLQMSLIVIGTLELIFAAFEIIGAIILLCIFCVFSFNNLKDVTIVIKKMQIKRSRDRKN
ncbi:uncharacterized protein [Magallana gigas]|uniref:uncharacterized protein isoform X2 n=1 Tax=Magallana gigas TaxID=29159 RepID=UPI0033414BA7